MMSEWGKKVHVESSLKKKDGQFAMFVGRWQPLHKGHQELFRQAMDEGKNVLICIRDVEPDEKNPFTTEQTVSMIKKYHESENDDVKVIVIPDIESVNFGRGVGYEINEYIPPRDVASISATGIRNCIKNKDDYWRKLVDPVIQEDVLNYLDEYL